MFANDTNRCGEATLPNLFHGASVRVGTAFRLLTKFWKSAELGNRFSALHIRCIIPAILCMWEYNHIVQEDNALLPGQFFCKFTLKI